MDKNGFLDDAAQYAVFAAGIMFFALVFWLALKLPAETAKNNADQQLVELELRDSLSDYLESTIAFNGKEMAVGDFLTTVRYDETNSAFFYEDIKDFFGSRRSFNGRFSFNVLSEGNNVLLSYSEGGEDVTNIMHSVNLYSKEYGRIHVQVTLV